MLSRSGMVCKLAIVSLLSLVTVYPSIQQSNSPDWTKVHSCFINVTERINGRVIQDRQYCCDGWTTVQDPSGSLTHCSAYVGTNQSNNDLLTLSDWRKTHKEIKKLEEEITPITAVLHRSQDSDPMDQVRQEVEHYSRVVDDLDTMVRTSEERVRNLENILSSMAEYNPCATATCLEHPDAICTVGSTTCGKKYPLFIDEETNHLSCSNIECPPDDECTANPCENVTCVEHPEAVCLVEACCRDYDKISWLLEGNVVECSDVRREHEGQGRRKRDLHIHC